MKKYLGIALALLTILSFVACSKESPYETLKSIEAPKTSTTNQLSENDLVSIEFLNNSDIEMTTRGFETIRVILKPETFSVENLEWISENPEIVKFEKSRTSTKDKLLGAISPIKPGTTTIYIKCNDVVSQKITVNISEYVSPYITLEKYERIKTGMTYQQVKGIIGEEGTLSSETELNEYSGKIYTWKQGYEIKDLGYASFLFQDDKLVSKSQVGLK